VAAWRREVLSVETWVAWAVVGALAGMPLMALDVIYVWLRYDCWSMKVSTENNCTIQVPHYEWHLYAVFGAAALVATVVMAWSIRRSAKGEPS